MKGLRAKILLLALAAALRFAGGEPFSIGYQWVCYLVFTAFMEEAVFRGLLPCLVERSGLSRRAVRVLPGVLFAWMHTLIPMVRGGLSLRGFAGQLLSALLGNALGHCGFYSRHTRKTAKFGG